jgi:polyisoprenoid-binding protein YceI
MTKWIIDPDHSVAAFAVRHMMIANVRGQFSKVTGIVHLDDDDITRSSVEVTIEVAGITTGIPKRDDHLRSADFFDAANFPTITFKSSHVGLTGLSSCKVLGDVTIRGITHPVLMDVNFLGPVKSPFGETSMGFTATTEINREDFNVMWNEPMEKGGVMAGKEVQIILDVEADLAE